MARDGRRWTISSWLIAALSGEVLSSIAYFRCGRTIAQYSGINADEDNSVKDQGTMKSNRLAVSAASLR